MKIDRVKKLSFISVDVASSRVRLSINKEQIDQNPGSTCVEVRMTKKETTQLIKALKAQRARKYLI